MKTHKELFSRFFEDPSREGLRDLLKNEVGELNELDFKGDWIENSKLAKHVLAIANYGGGCIVLGVATNEQNVLESKGIDKIKDKSEIGNAISGYIPKQLVYDSIDFNYKDSEYPTLKGKKFQVIIIEDSLSHVPFIAEKDGDAIRKAAIYTRVDTKSEEISYKELQEVISKRVETKYSSSSEFKMDHHISQLKQLYGVLKSHHMVFPGYSNLLAELDVSRITQFMEENPDYPKESVEDFVIRMINLKKQIIEELISR